MDNEYIFQLAKPYIKDNLLTYDDFEKIFSDFALREQYKISEILYYEYDIELVDTMSNELKISEEEVFINKNIKQTNEILCKLIQEGNLQAKQDLCIKNENLVMKFAIKYNKFLGNDLDVDDLKQAGMIGMLEAANRFNPAFDCKFSTYAIYWIEQAITRDIYEKGFKVRIPVHVFDTINKINRFDRMFYLKGEINYGLRMQKIATSMEISIEYLREIIKIKKMYLNNISLDMPINEEEDTTLGEIIPMEEEITLEDKIEFIELRKILEELFSTLKPKEVKVLRLRFGLDDGITRTLEEIGKSFGLTRERIRQIEERALHKLRHPSRSNKLKDFLS